jgi:hypothetical protein
MTRIRVAVISLLFILAQSGCNGMPPVAGYEVVPVIDRGSDLNNRLEELHASREMTPGQLKTILASRERSFLDNPSFNNRMNLALLLAVGEPAIQNQVRALELLKGIKSMPIDAGDQELVIILKQFLEAQVGISRKNDLLSKQLSEQDRKIEELKQQLRELTTIEQNIQHRDKTLEIGDGQ